jgi:hypothetical protein
MNPTDELTENLETGIETLSNVPRVPIKNN